MTLHSDNSKDLDNDEACKMLTGLEVMDHCSAPNNLQTTSHAAHLGGVVYKCSEHVLWMVSFLFYILVSFDTRLCVDLEPPCLVNWFSTDRGD